MSSNDILQRRPVSRFQNVRRALARPGTGEIIAVFLIITFPIMGTFFAPESYFAPQDFTIEGITDREVGFPFGRLSFVFLIIWEIYLFWKVPQTFRRGITRAFLPIIFILWSMITGFWTLDPAQSINRSFRTLIVVIFAAYFIERFSPKQVLNIITLSGCFAIIASIVAVVVMPQYGLTHLVGYEGAWRGATIHKNTLGALMATVFLFSYFALREKCVERKVGLGTLAGSLLLIVLARSATALVVVLLTMVLITCFEFIMKLRSKSERFFFLMLAMIFLCLAYLLHSTLSASLEVTGRDATLTGRTDIWEIVWEMIKRRPIWGYGSSFWAIDSSDRDYMWSVLGYAPPHAHNTYLDAWFQLGLPGLFILGVVEGTALWRTGRLFLGSTKGNSLVWSILLIILMFKGMVENALIGAITQDIFWLTIAYLGLSRWRTPASNAGSA